MECMTLLQEEPTSVEQVPLMVLERMRCKVYELFPLRLDDAFGKLQLLRYNEKFQGMELGSNNIVAVVQKVLGIVGGIENVEHLAKMVHALRIRIMAHSCLQFASMTAMCKDEKGTLVKTSFLPKAVAHFAKHPMASQIGR